jgi:predicted nucleic acid-binding Zn ribbon protein
MSGDRDPFPRETGDRAALPPRAGKPKQPVPRGTRTGGTTRVPRGTTQPEPVGTSPGDGDGDQGAELRGPDLARAALSRARAAARAKGVAPGAPRPRRADRDAARSGSGADGRDPVRFGTLISRLVADRGWEATTSAATVLASWDRLVGPDIADHCRPVSLTDGELVLVAESSAWATQLRLLTRTMCARLDERVGPGVVRSVVVRGPAQADWHRGPRRVRGRGPRDTYG